MAWSWSPVRLFGARLRVHVAFVALVVVCAALGSGSAAGSRVTGGLHGAALVAVLFGSVLAHELGHCAQARALGLRVRDVTLLPVGGFSRVEMGDDPGEALWVSLAGPVVNVGIAAVCAALALAARVPSPHSFSAFVLAVHRPGWGGLVVYAVGANLALGLLNLLPVPPLDGGRALAALLALGRGPDQGAELAGQVGHVVVCAVAAGALCLDSVALALAALLLAAGTLLDRHPTRVGRPLAPTDGP